MAGIAGSAAVAAGIVGLTLAPVTMGASVIAAASVTGAGAASTLLAGIISTNCSSQKTRQMTQLRQDIKAEMETFQDKINPMAEKMADIHECTDILVRIVKKQNQQARHLREYFDSVSKTYNRQIEELAELTKQMSETTRLIATIAAIYGGFSLVLDMFSVIENSRALNDMDKLAKNPVDEGEMKSKAGKFIAGMRTFIDQIQNIIDELQKTKDKVATYKITT